MRQAPAPEALNTEEKNEVPSSSGEHDQNDGSPWLLEWFPGFDIPIGLEGRAYLRRLLNHRRAEDPAACETLLAAHGIKLGRGVPGHTSNWGSMKVRELLHAAYLLGCWTAVEKLCINFCHANGLKTEWIRELKAKGGKQCVTLANLQNYRKKNREKKRAQPAETKEKKPSMAAAVPVTAPVAATVSGCVTGASSGVSDTTVSSVACGDVPSFCKQIEGDNGDDISCSSVVSKASKKSRRTSSLSCDQQTPCPYVSTLLGSQQPALPEPTPNPGFDYATPIPQFLPSDAQNSMPKHEITVQKGTLNICNTQSSVQLSLSLLRNAPTDPEGIAKTDSGNFITAPASRAFDSVSGFTHMLEEDATVTSSLTPCSSTSVTRMRRPKRRNGKAKSSGPRKRRQVSTRKSLTGVRTDSFSSVTSSEYPVVHVSKSVAHVSAVQVQCVESKFMARSELIPVSEHQSMEASAVPTDNRSFYGTWSLQEDLTRAAQRTVRTATSVAPSVSRSATRLAASVPRSADNARQTSPQCCHRWLTASLFWTDSSDNGSSETESLHSRTSTCTTTSSYSDSDHSFHEGCQCSFFKTKQVNFAGKKPAFTCFKTPCSPAGVTEAPFSLFMTAPTANEHARDPDDVSVAPAWTEAAAVPRESAAFANENLPRGSVSHHQRRNSLAEPIDVATGAAAIHGNSLSAVENREALIAGFWNAHPTPATGAVAAQESQETCTPEAFCGDADATTVHFSPHITPIDVNASSSYRADSETMESAECAQPLPAKREDLLKEWSLQGRHSAPGADPAVVRADKGELSSFTRAWKCPVQATSEIHQQKQGRLSGSTCYTHSLSSNDLSADIRCDTIDYCNRRSSGSSGQVVENAAATVPHICSSLRHEQLSVLQRGAEDRGENGSSSQPQQFSILRREAEDRGENPISLQTQQSTILQVETEDTVEGKRLTAIKAQSEDTHRAMLMKEGECPVNKNLPQRTITTDGLVSAPQTSSVIEEGIRSDTSVTHYMRSYVGNLLSSPLPCTETVGDTFLFGNYSQHQARNVNAGHGLDTTSGTTQTLYSTPHFPTKDSWVSYPGGRIGDYYTWGDDLRTESESPSLVSSTAPGRATPLFSPRSAALTGRSAAAATAMDAEAAYTASRRHTAEVCSMEEDDVPPNPFPLQLPPLAETQDLFFPSEIPRVEGWESQMAVWSKSSTAGAPAVGSDSTAAAEARRPTATAGAPENSAASPTQPPNATALSTEWGGLESNVNWGADKMVFQPPSESGHCVHMLESSYEITCGHPGNTLVPGATVQLTVRRSAVQ